MPMLLPRHGVNDPVIVTERTNLGNALMALHNAIAAQEVLFTSAAPALPIPSQLTDITTAVNNVATELVTLSGAGYTANGIRDCRDHIRDLCKMVRKAESNMDPYRVEYRRNVVSVADSVEGHNKALMTQALGGKIRRNTARIVNTAPVQAIAAHKGKIVGGLGAGALLYGILQMDGCSPSQQMPPAGSGTPNTAEKYHPVNKRDTDGGAEYDGNGEKFSVGGFLNASKVTFANGASPEAQAFQGVWNYIDEHQPDEKWGPGERFHFHTTPNKELKDLTHFDVNAYTIPHDGKVIEITWQKEDGEEKKGKNVEIEQLNTHTWRFTLNTNGTIEKTNVFHDGRGETSMGIITKVDFQKDLKKIQGF